MTRPPIVRLTAAFVAIGLIAIAVFAAFYIVGALAAVAVCAAIGIGLIALVAFASAKLSHRSGRQDVGHPLEPAHPPVADPPV
jgi:hypothetical protein